MRKCIICTTDKDEGLFNEEHVIPAALGGEIIIKNVCIGCNSDLGKTIDNDLLKNKLILYYRNVFDVARKENNRKNSVPNPFKGTFLDEKGNPHIVAFKDGKIVAQALNKFELNYSEEAGRDVAKLTIPIEKLDQADDIIKKYLKREGYQNLEYTLVSIEHNEPAGFVNVQAMMEHNSFIFGCLKIAYESTVNLFPSYINEPWAQEIRNVLKQSTISDSLRERLDQNHDLTKHYKQKFDGIDGLQITHHVILHEFVEGRGFICAIKLFDLVYSVTMSDTFRPLPAAHEIMIFNDIISGTYITNVKYEIPNISFALEMAGLSQETDTKIRTGNDNHFVKTDGKISVFKGNSEVLFADIHFLCLKLINENVDKFYWAQEKVQFDLTNQDCFLKTLDGTLIKMLSITPERKIILNKIY